MFVKGDEDGEFELEEDDITQIEQPVDEKQGTSDSTEHNAEDDQKDWDNTFLSQQPSVNYNSSHKTSDDKSPSNQDSSSSSSLSRNNDGTFLIVSVYIIMLFINEKYVLKNIISTGK